mgnify:FL=1|tara:strand:- start:1755 stop:3821 length:2067 start_codon:yes stop_codon:yes gene_type:complete
MSENQAYVTFPGVQQIESFSYTQGHGVAPGLITLDIAPQSVSDLPMYGDLKVFYNGIERLNLPMCLVDKASYTVNKSGKKIKLILKDWRWSLKKAKITATYNRKNGIGKIDTILKDAPFDEGYGLTSNAFLDPKQSLDEICNILEARLNFAHPFGGVFLKGELRKKDEFPYLKLTNKPVVQVIQQLCDKYGLVCFPEVGKGLNKGLILRTALKNSGSPPKQKSSLLTSEEAFDPPEVPKEVAVYSAPITFVKHLELHPVLEQFSEVDKSTWSDEYIIYPEDPHYVPIWEHTSVLFALQNGRNGAGVESPKRIWGIEAIRAGGVASTMAIPKGQYLQKYRIGHGGYNHFTCEKEELPDNQIFLKTQWKNAFAISNILGETNFYKPTIYHYSMISLLDYFPYQVDRNREEIGDRLGWIKNQNVQYSRPVVWGNRSRDGYMHNYSTEESIDQYYLAQDERGEKHSKNSYIIHALDKRGDGSSYSIDKKNRVVSLSRPLYRWADVRTLSDRLQNYNHDLDRAENLYVVPPYIFILAPFHLRSSITGDHLRLKRSEVVNANGVGREYVYIDDIKPYFFDDYNESNFDECQEKMRKEIRKLSASYKSVVAGKKSSYAGIVPMLLNGIVKSVNYSITQGGSTTTVNIGADLGFAMSRTNSQNYRDLSFALDREDYDEFHNPDNNFGREAEDFPFS